jgi:GT2 family glycosyltransferase
MELSIVIVSYNVCDYLRQALLSLQKAAVAVTHEIIVVENASSDGSAEMIREEFPYVKLITSDTNVGFSAACNRGIISSAGDFILILNPDTVVEPDALTLALAFMRSHPEAGASGARMVDGEGQFLPESKRGFPSPMTSFFRFAGVGKLFPRSRLFNAYYLGHLPEDVTCRADILTGAFMLIRREALDKAGLFDTAFFMYGEDIDLSWRITRAGYSNYYLPEVRITHFKGRSATSDEVRSVHYFYSAMIIFARKHLSRSWHLPVTACVTVMGFAARSSLRLKRLIKK